MRKMFAKAKVSALVLAAMLVLSGCGVQGVAAPTLAPTPTPTLEPSPSPTAEATPTAAATPTPHYSIEQFLPLEDVYYGYADETGRLVDSVVEYFNETTPVLQRRLIQQKHVQVFSIVDGALLEQYALDGVSYRYNFTSRQAQAQTVLLKAPIETGTEWDSADGHSAITDVGVRLRLPIGEYECVRVSTKRADGSAAERYYAPGMGLVAEYDTAVDGTRTSLELKYTETARPQSISVKLYYVSMASKSLRYTTRQLKFSANQSVVSRIASELRSAPSGLAPLTSGAKVSGVRVSGGRITINLAKPLNSVESNHEKLILYALINTYCDYYNASSARILAGGEAYVSDGLALGVDEYIPPIPASEIG
ncbi:hypothetical protein SDC9_117061 [bioreactor metagenome]|uniref:GerMN domain-containing protein n=1 Tax=bioreactor metagenome TaxID=1076179 RepID=A0A645BXJ0_9ZZZZ